MNFHIWAKLWDFCEHEAGWEIKALSPESPLCWECQCRTVQLTCLGIPVGMVQLLALCPLAPPGARWSQGFIPLFFNYYCFLSLPQFRKGWEVLPQKTGRVKESMFDLSSLCFLIQKCGKGKWSWFNSGDITWTFLSLPWHCLGLIRGCGTYISGFWSVAHKLLGV